MNISKNELDLINPSVFDDLAGINAWFTLKNEGQVKPSADIPGLNLGFNTSSDKEQIVENRDLLFKALDLEPDWTAFADQVHGTRVRSINSGGIYPETDGLGTRVPGLTLGIQVADCAAVLLADPIFNIVGAVHAGWRGAAGGILLNALNILEEEGSDPSNLRAWVSPCLSLKNFEVGHEVAEQFPVQFVDHITYEKPHVDLKAFLKYQLIDNGLKENYIQLDPHCTIEGDNQFYSFRRENDKAGRMMALIQLAD
ncbi:MAG: peptidoglycan editing factor PgeF [Balneolaceae bacterium]|nr:peptidoglycan editing factor PgeF [Balneolaceae bacterium]